MATVTYYFDGYDAGECWFSNPANLCDGDDNAWSTALGVILDVQSLNSNTCDGSNLGSITKVEIRERLLAGTADKGGTVRPEFAGGDGDNHLFVPATFNPEWSSWFDITSDTNAPANWTWGNVKDLKCDIENTNPTNVVSASIVQIRVTYILPSKLIGKQNNESDLHGKQESC